MSRSSRILVAGGGPAGCLGAMGLAVLGYRVRLITTPRRPAIEGLSERVLQALETSGCPRALATVGPAVRREASWSGEVSEANREWVVTRDRFDAALLDDAAEAGVVICHDRIVKTTRHPKGWQVDTSDEGEYCASYLVEARGRRAPGQRLHGPATTALGRMFAGVPPQARTAVAGFRQGWAWYASTGDGRGALQVLLSTMGPLPGRRQLPEFFGRLPGAVAEARGWLGDGRGTGPIWARHAETSRALAPIEARMIRVGDAALAMDPLSGHGVFEAIASAKAAVPVVNTVLARPGDADLAHAFYEERVRLGFERFARIGRDFYALERRWPDADFWRERRLWPDDQPAHTPPFAEAPRIEAKPVIADGFVVQRPVVVTADQPRGVWQVDGVPIVDFLEWHRAHPDPSNVEVLNAAAARFAVVPSQVVTALDWLRHRRLLGAIDRGD